MVERIERRGSWLFSSTIDEVPVCNGQHRVESVDENDNTKFDDNSKVFLHGAGSSVQKQPQVQNFTCLV
jgi:hypothetical protein